VLLFAVCENRYFYSRPSHLTAYEYCEIARNRQAKHVHRINFGRVKANEGFFMNCGFRLLTVNINQEMISRFPHLNCTYTSFHGTVRNRLLEVANSFFLAHHTLHSFLILNLGTHTTFNHHALAFHRCLGSFRRCIHGRTCRCVSWWVQACPE
jgi:hypothetical protein